MTFWPDKEIRRQIDRGFEPRKFVFPGHLVRRVWPEREGLLIVMDEEEAMRLLAAAAELGK